MNRSRPSSCEPLSWQARSIASTASPSQPIVACSGHTSHQREHTQATTHAGDILTLGDGQDRVAHTGHNSS